MNRTIVYAIASGLVASIAVGAAVTSGASTETDCWDQYSVSGTRFVRTVAPKGLDLDDCTSGSDCLWGLDRDGKQNRLYVPFGERPASACDDLDVGVTTTTTTPIITLPSTTAPSTTTTLAPSNPVTSTTLAPGGSPGCGLVSVAFCDGFDVRGSSGNRNGDLPLDTYSVSRWRSEMSPAAGYVGRVSVPACRAGAATNALPPGDVLVCDPSATIKSPHALIATAEQNYGDTIARIAQPFDIAGRTGTIRFDTNPTLGNTLLGWPILLYTADPYSAPSYFANNSGGATPRQGIALHFNGQCSGGGQWSPTPTVRTHTQYAETLLTSDGGCTAPVSVQDGHLNRVEVRISTSRIEVWISDASPDGVTFGPLTKMFSSNIGLGFTRGNLYIGTHNHATVKYSGQPSWTTYWDNVAFDGPELPAQHVAQINHADTPNGDGVNLGHPLTNGSPTSHTFTNVDIDNATNATLTFNLMADRLKNDIAAMRINYRLNNGTWHTAGLTTAELALANTRSGTYTFSIPIDPAELHNGTNTIQFDGTNLHNGYQPFIGNIDLITH